LMEQTQTTNPWQISFLQALCKTWMHNTTIEPSKKPLLKQPCQPLHLCGVFLYDGAIKKTLVFLKTLPSATDSPDFFL
jgi:hypothetical protein